MGEGLRAWNSLGKGFEDTGCDAGRLALEDAGSDSVPGGVRSGVPAGVSAPSRNRLRATADVDLSGNWTRLLSSGEEVEMDSTASG